MHPCVKYWKRAIGGGQRGRLAGLARSLWTILSVIYTQLPPHNTGSWSTHTRLLRFSIWRPTRRSANKYPWKLRRWRLDRWQQHYWAVSTRQKALFHSGGWYETLDMAEWYALTAPNKSPPLAPIGLTPDYPRLTYHPWSQCNNIIWNLITMRQQR